MKRLSIIVIGVLLTLAQLSQVFGAEKTEMSEGDKKKEARKGYHITTYTGNKYSGNDRWEHYFKKKVKRLSYDQNLIASISDYATITEKDVKLLSAIRMKEEGDYLHYFFYLKGVKTCPSTITRNKNLRPEPESLIGNEYVDYIRAKAIEEYKPSAGKSYCIEPGNPSELVKSYSFESGDPSELIQSLVNGIYFYPSSLGFKEITSDEYFDIVKLYVDAICQYLYKEYIKNEYGVTLD